MIKRVPLRLRELVRERAGSRCEYCLIHQDDVLFPHVPDHVIARKHGGISELANLAWSCYLCNHLKGSDIGRVTDHLLQMNLKRSVEARQALLEEGRYPG
jgi:5-methylcytosine-specific restriction endonuclease McrA